MFGRMDGDGRAKDMSDFIRREGVREEVGFSIASIKISLSASNVMQE